VIQETSKVENVVWHSGPPPSIGWWPADLFGQIDFLRWWDGKKWSSFALPEFTAIEAAKIASRKDPRQKSILWAERWW